MGGEEIDTYLGQTNQVKTFFHFIITGIEQTLQFIF